LLILIRYTFVKHLRSSS